MSIALPYHAWFVGHQTEPAAPGSGNCPGWGAVGRLSAGGRSHEHVAALASHARNRRRALVPGLLMAVSNVPIPAVSRGTKEPGGSGRKGLFNDLVGLSQQQLRYGKAEHLRGLQIDDELEFGRLRGKGSVGGILAFQDAVDPTPAFTSCGATIAARARP